MSTSRDLAAAVKSAGKKPMASVEVVGVGNMKPSDIGKAVRVKVYRKWTVISARGAKPAMLTFILLDQMGGAIQANVEPREHNRFENTLETGSAYTITGFGLQDAKKWMQTLPNNFILMLGKLTDVQPFFEGHFPAHHFRFAPYDELPLRADRNDVILTDYIGCVLHIGDLRQPGVGNQRTVIWRDIILRNLEGNTVRFTLWNEKARDFDTDAYEKEPKPTVMAVSSCWVKTYGGLQLSATVATSYYLNPVIPETDYILSMYAELLTPPVIQNVRTQRYDDIEQEKLRNRTTVDELLREDPRNQTNVRFTVVATIAYVRAGRPWYFRRCTDCRHKIFEDRLHGHCKQPEPEEPKDYRMPIADETGTLMLTCFSNEAHSLVTECNKVVSEQGHTDPYTLPPVLNELQGTTHLFQLHFASESTKENRVYRLDTVMESGQHLLPAPPHEEAIDQPFMEPANEVVYLTGPEDETERVAEAASADGGPVTPLASNILPVSVEAATEATPEGPQPALPATPLSTEIFQVSDPVTIGSTSGMQQGTSKIQATKQPVRRQLLKSEPIDQPCTAAKKSRQE